MAPELSLHRGNDFRVHRVWNRAALSACIPLTGELSFERAVAT